MPEPVTTSFVSSASLKPLWEKLQAIRGDRDLLFASLAVDHARHARYYAYNNLVKVRKYGVFSDPRAKQILRDYGFEAYWRAHGWPAHCKPKGETDFACR